MGFVDDLETLHRLAQDDLPLYERVRPVQWIDESPSGTTLFTGLNFDETSAMLAGARHPRRMGEVIIVYLLAEDGAPVPGKPQYFGWLGDDAASEGVAVALSEYRAAVTARYQDPAEVEVRRSAAYEDLERRLRAFLLPTASLPAWLTAPAPSAGPEF